MEIYEVCFLCLIFYTAGWYVGDINGKLFTKLLLRRAEKNKVTIKNLFPEG